MPFDVSPLKLSAPDIVNKPLNFGSAGSAGSSAGGSLGLGLVGAGLNIGTSIYNNMEARHAADVAYRRQKELLEKQMRFASSEAEKQRYASSLVNIVNQMRALGMNEDLLYGGGASSQGSMSSASSPGIGHVQAASIYPMARVTDSIESVANARRADLIESEIDVNRSMAQKNNADALRSETLLPVDLQLRQSELEVNNSVIVKNAADANLSEEQVGLVRKTIEEKGAVINRINQEIQESVSRANLNNVRAALSQKELDRYDEHMNAVINELNARVKNYLAQNRYYSSMVSVNDANVRNMTEYILSEYGVDLNGNGNREDGAAFAKKLGIVMQNGKLALEYDFEKDTYDSRVENAKLAPRATRSEIRRNNARTFQLYASGVTDIGNMFANSAGELMKVVSTLGLIK